MKKALILFTAIFLAINTSGQSGKDIHFDHKQKRDLWNAEDLKGIKERYFTPARKKVSGNNQAKSLLAIKQKLESEISEVWDGAAGKWVTYGKYRYTYDENLNCILNLTSYWDQVNNQWLDFDKIVFTYNIQGNVTSQIDEIWNNYDKQWIFSDKWEYEYDASGNCIIDHLFRWNEISGQWEMHHTDEYTFDVKGNRIAQAGTSLDEDTNQWVPGEKEEYSYDTNGNMTLINHFYLDNVTSQWINHGKEEYVYDSTGNNTVISNYSFSVQDSIWHETQREERTYDLNRNLTAIVQNDWGDLSKTEITYDNNYSFEELILPYLFTEEYCRHMWTMMMYYSHTDAGWNLENRATMNYTEVNTSDISSLEDKGICLYPNPASQFVSFDADIPLSDATLELFDMQGRKVMSRVVVNNAPVSVKHLDKGLYVYRISDARKDYKGKLVIE